MKETYNRKLVGERIRKKRKQIGLTQQELAKQIHRAYKYYQDIERGTCGMSIETMLALANTLHISLDYLIYGDEIELLEKEMEDRKFQRIVNVLRENGVQQKEDILRIIDVFGK